jgi:hypothetical protein
MGHPELKATALTEAAGEIERHANDVAYNDKLATYTKIQNWIEILDKAVQDHVTESTKSDFTNGLEQLRSAGASVAGAMGNYSSVPYPEAVTAAAKALRDITKAFESESEAAAGQHAAAAAEAQQDQEALQEQENQETED